MISKAIQGRLPPAALYAHARNYAIAPWRVARADLTQAARELVPMVSLWQESHKKAQGKKKIALALLAVVFSSARAHILIVTGTLFLLA